jgi:hypothetical protein
MEGETVHDWILRHFYEPGAQARCPSNCSPSKTAHYARRFGWKLEVRGEYLVRTDLGRLCPHCGGPI